MDKGMNFFYILSGPLGYVMEWIYKLLPSYGWDIIIFTLLINIVKIPLQTSQQKSMAKMSAFQPMIAEIQTKYKDKPEKQQEELMKLQQEFGYKPTAGCMPMLVNCLSGLSLYFFWMSAIIGWKADILAMLFCWLSCRGMLSRRMTMVKMMMSQP